MIPDGRGYGRSLDSKCKPGCKALSVVEICSHNRQPCPLLSLDSHPRGLDTHDALGRCFHRAVKDLIECTMASSLDHAPPEVVGVAVQDASGKAQTEPRPPSQATARLDGREVVNVWNAAAT